MSDLDAAAIFLGKPPPTVALFGWRLIAVDIAAGTIEVGFEGKPEFTNPAGYVQGGILTAMMDDAMGPCLVLHLKGRAFPSSIDLSTHFLRPVRPGAVTVKARVRQAGRTVAFLEAELFDSRGKLCATCSSSAALITGVFTPPTEATA